MAITLPVEDIELARNMYFSPGYFYFFWRDVVAAKYSYHQIVTSNKLKPYREVWAGAIIAAHQTAATGRQHFVGLPDDEPPDIRIVSLEEVATKSGRLGTNLQRLEMEVTWCDIERGDTLLGHIDLKNKPAYQDMHLLIYLTRPPETMDFNGVRKTLKGRQVHLASIMVVAEVHEINNAPAPKDSYAVVSLLSEAQTAVSTTDQVSFFVQPEIIRVSKRGISTELMEGGTVRLVPPDPI